MSIKHKPQKTVGTVKIINGDDCSRGRASSMIEGPTVQIVSQNYQKKQITQSQILKDYDRLIEQKVKNQFNEEAKYNAKDFPFLNNVLKIFQRALMKKHENYQKLQSAYRQKKKFNQEAAKLNQQISKRIYRLQEEQSRLKSTINMQREIKSQETNQSPARQIYDSKQSIGASMPQYREKITDVPKGMRKAESQNLAIKASSQKNGMFEINKPLTSNQKIKTNEDEFLIIKGNILTTFQPQSQEVGMPKFNKLLVSKQNSKESENQLLNLRHINLQRHKTQPQPWISKEKHISQANEVKPQKPKNNLSFSVSKPYQRDHDEQKLYIFNGPLKSKFRTTNDNPEKPNPSRVVKATTLQPLIQDMIKTNELLQNRLNKLKLRK